MPRYTTSINRCVIFYTDNFILLFGDKKTRKVRHACLSPMLSELADLNINVSKVFARDREKEVAHVSFREAKRACFIIRDTPSMLKRIADFNASNSQLSLLSNSSTCEDACENGPFRRVGY